MSNLVLYGGTLGAIIVLGYTLYCRYRIARLEKQIADMEALKAGVASRDEKISALESELESEARKDHAEDVLQAGKITDERDAIGFLRDAVRKGRTP
jgi:Tfp pilus assembly protein PilO